MSSLKFEAIGTQWTIDMYDSVSHEALSSLRRTIDSRIEQFDKAYSRFRPDSLVMEMASKAGTFELPPDAKPMLDLYEKLYKATGGLFTPLVGQLLADAGYDASYTLIERELRPVPAWEDVLEYDFPRLTLKSPALLDFGGLGKGYLIDIIGHLIAEAGFKEFLVDAGGDMLHRSAEGRVQRVGLEHPSDFSKAIGITMLSNKSLSGSAGNRRAWGRFHHIMDPKTLESPRYILASWATAETALIADAMATCLFFVPARRLAEFEFEYLIVRPDGSFERSDGFQCELFIAGV